MIACKIAKEIWDTLEPQCQGTDSIKNNGRAILIQEYEKFVAKADESLTDVYDRFLTLLNNLSLFKKEYDAEDSNIKFLRALLGEWIHNLQSLDISMILILCLLMNSMGCYEPMILRFNRGRTRKAARQNLLP